MVSLNLSLNEVVSLVATSETAWAAAAGQKLKHAIIPCKCQTPVAIHVYSALQLMQATVLPIKF